MMARLNISIDDVSPHPQTPLSVIVKRCERVLQSFPDAKFTFFVPVAYWRTIGPEATIGPLSIDEFPGFCDILRSLPKETYEIAYHGFNHGIPNVSNNDELWKDAEGHLLSLDAALRIIRDMKAIVYKAGLTNEFKGIIRPPAWRMSPSVFQACLIEGITTFALSPDEYALKTYEGMEKQVRSVMYDCCPPSKPLMLLDKTEIMFHACTWDVSFFSDTFIEELITFLEKNRDDIDFCFIDELV